MSATNPNCPICFEVFGEPETPPPVAGPCLHSICQSCFELLAIKVCPSCRDPIPVVRKNCELLNLIAPQFFSEHAIPSSSLPRLNTPDGISEHPSKTRAEEYLRSDSEKDPLSPLPLVLKDFLYLCQNEKELAKRVLGKIYQHLLQSYTDECEAQATFKVSGIKLRFNNLCYFAARDSSMREEDPVARLCYGYCLYHGINFPQNVNEAISHFEFAAAKNYALAHYFLGLAYLKGNGVNLNWKTALSHFGKAGRLNCVPAITELGLCYLFGPKEGVPEIPRGLDYLKMAAERGDVRALTALGDFYSTYKFPGREHISFDFELATHYYVKAVERGSESAISDVERCLNAQEKPLSNHNACTLM